MSRNPAATPAEEQRRRAVRRSALVFSLIALAFYLGFIIMAVVRGSS